jgi:maltooligosyltrehalose trehalohydrolase
MRRRHLMPFGASLRADGGVDFALWAPGASTVQLELGQGADKRALPMESEQGWYRASVPGVAAGARYAYRIDDKLSVPDPASRHNPDDVHAASALVDPTAFEWSDEAWRGRPWEEAVLYELHVGTFTPEGTFNGAIERFDYLVRLGVTAIELMPVADFPGKRNWGYDGVLPFAPDAAYGTPEELKSLIAAAHARGLMVLLDVVYNHFGPEGNYLHAYAPQFFNAAHQTPWGAAINFDGEHARTVRDFFIHNALYWLEEFNFDGLRLDAVHAIADESKPDIVSELARAVREGPGAARHVHLVLENDRNEARYLERKGAQPVLANAQWNDDFHHALHVLATGEHDGYYEDYAQTPLKQLGRALAEGFVYQGENSAHRGGKPRGERSAHLSPSAFVDFLQTHDQVGNRALGERIAHLAPPHALKLGVVCLLLAPSTPMLFMGEEFGASAPFQFFCDFGPELAQAVRDGRRSEFASFGRFRDPAAQAQIPDPNDEATFLRSKLSWQETAEPGHRDWHILYSDLLELRRRLLVPHLAGERHSARYTVHGESGLAVDWTLNDGAQLHLRANFSEAAWTGVPPAQGALLYSTHPVPAADTLPPWSAVWTLEDLHG